ncbi:MAG: hypothetical protein PVF58_06390 [Candidatus Methanofastidiosia archaeon]|jgi:hypothetical protein
MKGVIIIYKAKGKSSSSQLSRALYGYKDYSNKGKYLYYRKGLLKKIPHIKLMRGVFIVKKEDAEKFISLLKRYKIVFHIREVILTPQDIEKFGLV